MSIKESERRMAEPAAVATVPAGLQDSPSVERALGRSKLYLLISWSMLYPEDEEFLDYLQCGEFVEDGRSAVESLNKALDGIGGDRGKTKLASIAGHLDQIERWVSSECVNWQLLDLQSEHRRVFSNVITLD